MNCLRHGCDGKLNWTWGSPEKDGEFEERFHCTLCGASHTRKVQYDVSPIAEVLTLDVERGGSPPEGVERPIFCTDRDCKDGYYMDDVGDMVRMRLFPVTAIGEQVWQVNGQAYIAIQSGEGNTTVEWVRLKIANQLEIERFIDNVFAGRITKFKELKEGESDDKS